MNISNGNAISITSRSQPLGDLVLNLRFSIDRIGVSGAPKSRTEAIAHMNASTVNPYKIIKYHDNYWAQMECLE